MALKTQVTNKSVDKFVESISDEERRKETKQLIKIFKEITGENPKIWGDNFIIGFGKYKYKRKGGKEEFEWFNVGFAPRARNITLYFSSYVSDEKELLAKLGKHKVGKGCLYLNHLEDVDLSVLKKLIEKNKKSAWTNS